MLGTGWQLRRTGALRRQVLELLSWKLQLATETHGITRTNNEVYGFITLPGR
jgi:hypothetical protein